METATQLIVAWKENATAQAELAAFLDGATGRSVLSLLKELNRTVHLPTIVPGIEPEKVAAGRLNQVIGWNRCIDQIVAMTAMRPDRQDNLQPWAHYGEAQENNNQENQ